MQLGNFILFMTLFSLRDFARPWGLLLLSCYRFSIEKKKGFY
jgi:hypothetical protein